MARPKTRPTTRKDLLTLGLLALVLILFAAFWGSRSHRQAEPLASLPDQQATPASLTPSPFLDSIVSQTNFQTAGPTLRARAAGNIDPKELEFTIPDFATYREQIIAFNRQEGHHHHGLAPVLREFSHRMAELMEKAAESPKFASALFDRLADCANGDQKSLHQARTICAVNAIRLGEMHPQTLSSRASSFRKTLNARVKTSVQAMSY